LKEQGTENEAMRTFKLDTASGLDPGFAYVVRARAHTYISDYFSLSTTWSATATFYSSALPETISGATFIYSALSKTDVTIGWSLLPSAAA